MLFEGELSKHQGFHAKDKNLLLVVETWSVDAKVFVLLDLNLLEYFDIVKCVVLTL